MAFELVIGTSKTPACLGTGSCNLWEQILAGGAAIGAIAAGAMAVIAYAIKVITEAGFENWRRQRRRLEILRALRAELRDSIKNYRSKYLRPDLSPDHPGKPAKQMRDRFMEALMTGEPHIPFVAFVSSDMLWELIRPELVALDGRLLDDIASYYYADRLLGQLFLDFRSDAYKALSISRQMSVALYMFEHVADVVAIGRKIVRKIDAYERSFWRLVKSLAFGACCAATLVVVAAIFAAR